MSLRRTTAWCALGLLIVVLCGCQRSPAAFEGSSGPAEAVSDYFLALEKQDFDRALVQFAPDKRLASQPGLRSALAGSPPRFDEVTRVEATRIPVRRRVVFVVERSGARMEGRIYVEEIEGRWFLSPPKE